MPWQSGSDGREETQTLHLNPQSGRWTPDNTRLQRHVNSAIAYNVWQYYQVTGDWEFLSFYGAEMILEIARFWASIATYNRTLDRYEILGVMGPDEYHDRYPDATEPGLNNTAYTNIMAAWVMCRALDVLDMLSGDRRLELREVHGISREEAQLWQEISHKMRVVFHDHGIISQFEGYDQLEEFDWERYRRKYGNIQRLDRILEAEGDTPNRYKLSKQADVLMLFYLFSSDELRQLFKRQNNISREEAQLWQEISHKMRVVFHDHGIISQFEGYDQLEEFDWERYRRKYGNIQRLDRILEAEGDTPNRYKLSKQADVLMLFYLFSSDEKR